MAVGLVKQDFPVVHLCWLPQPPFKNAFQEDSFPSHYQGLRWGWLACRHPNLPSWFSWRVVFSLFESTGTSLNLPGHAKINKSGPAMALASSLNTWAQSLRFTEFQVKCTLTQSLTPKVPDFPTSLGPGIPACLFYWQWLMQRQHREPQPSPCHQLPCPIWQQAHLCCSCPWRILSCYSACRLRNYPTANGYSGSSGHVPFATLTMQSKTSGSNKEKPFIAQGEAAQESKLMFLAYALCSGRQHTEMISLVLFKIFFTLCISTTISNFCINV